MANNAKAYENDSLAGEIDDMLSGYTPSEQSTEKADEDEESKNDSETEEEEDEGSEEEEEDSSEEAEEEAETDESDEGEDSEEDDEVVDEEGAGEDEENESEDDDADDSMSREALYDELNRLAAGQLDLGEQSEGGDAEDSGEQSKGDSRGGQSLGADDSQLDVFGEDLDFDDVVTKPEAFVKAMGRLANQTQLLTQQNVMRSMVGLVAQQVAQQLQLKEMADKFWADNEDLKPVQKYVGAVASAYQSKNPDKEIGVVFEETARIVREKLGLKKGGGGNPIKKSGQRKRRSSPALVKGRSRRAQSQKVKPTKLQSQIDDIIDEL